MALATGSSPADQPPERLLTLAGSTALGVLRQPATLLGALAASSIFWVCLLGLVRRWEQLLLPLIRGEATLSRELTGSCLLGFALACAATTLGALGLSWTRRDQARIPRLLGPLATTAATALFSGGVIFFCQLTALGATLGLALFAQRPLQAAALASFVVVPCSLLLRFVSAAGYLALARIHAAAIAPTPWAGPGLLATALADLLADPLRSLRLLGALTLFTLPVRILAALAFLAALTSPSLPASLLLLLPVALGSGAAALTMARGLHRGVKLGVS